MIGMSGQATTPDAPLNPQSPYGQSYDADIGEHGFPVSVTHSGSITVASSSANPVEISFDSGLTWPMMMEEGESQSWGTDPVNGSVLSQIRVRGLRADPLVGVPASWKMTGD